MRPNRVIVEIDSGLNECEFCHVILNHFGHSPECADIARAEARRLRHYEREAILDELGITPGSPLIDFDSQERP